MRAGIRHFFETASEKEKRQAKAHWNHTLNTIRIKAETAKRQELGAKGNGQEKEDGSGKIHTPNDAIIRR